MQRTALLAGLLLLLATVASAEAVPLAFKTPGSFDAARLQSESLDWVLLVFANGTSADLRIDAPDGAHLVNETVFHAVRGRYGDNMATFDGPPDRSERRLPGPLKIEAAYRPMQAASVLVMAEGLTLEFESADGELRTKPQGKTLDGFSRPTDWENDLYRLDRSPGGDDVVLTTTPLHPGSPVHFRLAAHGPTSVEWYNADVECWPGEGCPTGGGPSILHLGGVPRYSASVEHHSYETLTGNFQFQATGSFDYAVLGSANLTVTLDGSVRLPLASGTGLACQSCISPDRQTLAATGNITLAGLRMAADGGIGGDLDGDLQTARLDEQAVDPALLKGGRAAVGIAAAVGVGFLLVKYLLAPLFTLNPGEDALDNARRRRIYNHVVQNPGVHMREALRATEIPAGAGRYHVNRLVKAGILVARRGKSTVALFENHGKYDATWHDLAMLRDGNIRLLMEWISANPGSTQKTVIGAFQEWNRSTTQKRLLRLESAGLIKARLHGQFKVYFALRPVRDVGVAAPKMVVGA